MIIPISTITITLISGAAGLYLMKWLQERPQAQLALVPAVIQK